MYTLHPDTRQNALAHDAARAAAEHLRREAIDDFWRGANAALQRSLQAGPAHLARSARRLEARLTRHWHNRDASALEG